MPLSEIKSRLTEAEFELIASSIKAEVYADVKNDILTSVREICAQEMQPIKTTVEAIRTAFLIDDRGADDYHGHRVDHLSRKEVGEKVDTLKMQGAKQLVNIVLSALAGLLVAGFIAWINSGGKL